MRRPIFVAWTGLVLGETAILALGKTGLYLPLVLFLLFVLLWHLEKKRGILTGKIPPGIWGKGFTDGGRGAGFVLFCLFMLVGAVCLLAQEEADQVELFLDQAGRKGMISVPGSLRGRIESVKMSSGGKSLILGKGALFQYRDRILVCSFRCRVTGTEEKADGEIQRKVFSLQKESQTGEGTATLCPGDKITVSGKLQAFAEPENPGEFPAKNYYFANGIRYTMSGQGITVLERPFFSPARAAFLFGRKMAEVYGNCVAERERGLFKAMVLGDKSELSQETRELYEENGVAHLLAISGLHVSVVGGWVFSILRKRGAGYGPACAAGSLLLAAYGSMVGPGGSMTRAIVMYMVFLLSQYFGADYDIPSALALAGCALLLSSPLRIKESGSILSFASVFAIGMIWPWARERLEGRRKMAGRTGELGVRDLELSIRTRLGFRLEKGHPLLVERCRDNFTAGLVINMVTMPLILEFFYGWSPYSILLNMLVLPAMMPVMLSALGGGLAGSLLSMWSRAAGIRAGFLLCLPAEILLRCFNWIFERVQQFPFSFWQTGCPGVRYLFFLYGLEMAAVFLWYHRKWLQLAALGLAISIAFALGPRKNLDMTLLSVGQGECILLRLPDGRNMMVDGGSTSRKEIGKYVIGPALKYYGIRRLDYMVITHMDEDHISGIRELLEKDYPVRYLIVPEMGEAEKGDDHFQEMVELARTRGVSVHRIQRGNQINCGPVRLYCLHPCQELDSVDRNAYSVVLYLEYRDFDALLTGDLAGEQEEVLLSWLKSMTGEDRQRIMPGLDDGLSLLKLAHHGSSHSSTAAFLEEFRPGKAVVSAGKNNRYGHPHKETLERLAAVGLGLPGIYGTLWGGAVELETDGRDFRIGYWKEDP